MIIHRYIIREIIKPMGLITLVLTVIFASFSSANYLADAAHGLLTANTVLSLTALKTLIGLEALLPTALYLAVIIGLGRLYNDSEMTALAASGFGELQVLKAVAGPVILVAAMVAALTLSIRPWAYGMAYRLEARALATLDIDKLEGGRFYRLGQTDNVLFASRIDRDDNKLEDVFFRSSPETGTQIIRAREAHLSTSGDRPVMVFVDGRGYGIDDQGSADLVLRFHTLALPLDPGGGDIGYKRKAVSLQRLAASRNPGDLAEYQWRLSMPVASLVLGLLAVPLSRSRPRHGRFSRLFVAILAFALYYNLLSVARTWVDQGKVPAMPGIWWAHFIPAAILFMLLIQPYARLRLERDRKPTPES